MNKRLILIAIATLILSGCNTVTPKQEPRPKEVVTDKNPSEVAQSLDYAGTYETKLPCEDCDYMMARLQLNQYGQYQYMEQEVKNGGPVGQPIVFRGRYIWDKNSPVIQLMNARNMHFLVAENEVALLSTPITSYAALTTEPKFQKVVR